MFKKSSIALLLALALAVPAAAQQPDPRKEGNIVQIRSDAPDRYTVRKGDTLWGISARFLKEPWQWPLIWRLNSAEIRNPHLIYPGDVIVFDRATGTLSIERVSPRVRAEPLAGEAIPSIPPRVIEPFLTQPLVVEEDGLKNAPEIVATELGRYNVGQGNRVYAEGIGDSTEPLWYMYRQGRAIVDPDTKRTLGFEAVNLGTARLTKRGHPSTLQIIKSTREVSQGDRLVAVGPTRVFNYVPHKPAAEINARVIMISDGETDTRSDIYGADQAAYLQDDGRVGSFRREAGPLQIVVLNKGAKDGLELGHVLALHRSFVVRNDRSIGSWYMGEPRKPDVTLPEQRYGLVFVFRTFENVSYALVVQASEPVTPRDVARTP
ncbi:MAG: LysM peptidoglycan-binding domain-containing protein [Burkholderiales bacterium]|nr:LysM peptidoglycan-binding domain-containing protein [Burkholderiales bacterium]